MMKGWVHFPNCQPMKMLLPFFILVSLAACNFPLDSQTPSFDPTSFSKTVEVQLTQMAANVSTMVGGNLTPPAVTPTPIVITLTPSPVLSFAFPPAEVACDRAGAGAILDVTYPDDSRLLPGQPFTKIWRLVNRGSCSWNRDYQVVWFSGDQLGTSSLQPLPGKVEPGESVDIAVDMLAPQQPGLYTSYWMLRNPEGKLFGIGPGGNAPFWVRIQVVAVYTPTPTSVPTMTPTPMILASGRLELQPGLGVDLDSGKVTDDEGVDLRLIQSEEGSFWFEVDENAGLMILGEVAPSLNDCRSAIFSSTRISVESLSEGLNLCYRTNEGLPGSMRMVSVSQAPLVMRFDFVTWLIP